MKGSLNTNLTMTPDPFFLSYELVTMAVKLVRKVKMSISCSIKEFFFGVGGKNHADIQEKTSTSLPG